MHRYIYPAILYTDGPDDTFCLVLNDLHLVTEGKSVEETFELMKVYLEGYFDCLLKMEEEIPEASKYNAVAKAKSKNIVLLVDVKVEGDKVL